MISRGTPNRLDRLAEMVLAENLRQNLISKSTEASFTRRHIDDSLQLLPYCRAGVLLDIGSGGGFPGLVLACSVATPVILTEPRRRRAEFLSAVVAALDLPLVTVFAGKVEQLSLTPVATITARAVASLERLFAMAAHLADDATIWVLPKGRTAAGEVAAARASWHGEFELVSSRTDPDAAIVVARRVRRKGQR